MLIIETITKVYQVELNQTEARVLSAFCGTLSDVDVEEQMQGILSDSEIDELNTVLAQLNHHLKED